MHHINRGCPDDSEGDKMENFKVSYECSELIKEIKEDISAFGNDEQCHAFYETLNGHQVLTNYDFIEPEMPLTFEEKEDCVVVIRTLKNVLEILEEQNKII